MDFGNDLTTNINLGDMLAKNAPSPAATFRKMYPKLRDRDVHLFELGTYTYQWVDGWRTDVWFKKGHVEIIKDSNDHDPRWVRYLYPQEEKKQRLTNWPEIWNVGGSPPSYKSGDSVSWSFNNFRVYVVQNKGIF